MPGFDEFRARLLAVAEAPISVPPAVADVINGHLAESFVHQTDPYGRPWPPLSPKTVRRKGHARIMIETGAMLTDTEAKAAGWRIDIRGPKYGPYHQRAHANKWGHTNPARPLVPNESALPNEWQHSIQAEADKAIATALKR